MSSDNELWLSAKFPIYVKDFNFSSIVCYGERFLFLGAGEPKVILGRSKESFLFHHTSQSSHHALCSPLSLHLDDDDEGLELSPATSGQKETERVSATTIAEGENLVGGYEFNNGCSSTLTGICMSTGPTKAATGPMVIISGKIMNISV